MLRSDEFRLIAGNPLSNLQSSAAKVLQASDWWAGLNGIGGNGVRYGNLAWYLSRLHACPVVERFFSMLTNVQSKSRASLETVKASKFTSAHAIMTSGNSMLDETKVQPEILRFVWKC